MSDPSAAAPAVRLGYRPALDGLRGIAILLVVIHHVGAFLLPASFGPRLLPAGFLGVDVFFVLSGFLITTLLLERQHEPQRVRRFYLRRALRLLPAVGVLLAVAAVVAAGAGESTTRIANTILVVGTYTTNWATIHGVSVLPPVTHLWSLAVEEQFYLLWPALLWMLLGTGATRRTIGLLTLGLALVFAAWRYGVYTRTDLGAQLYFRSDTRADGLLIGAALAFVPLGLFERLGARTALALGLAGGAVLGATVALTELVSPWLYRGGFTVVAVAVAALVVSALRTGSIPERALSWRPLVTTGVLSYSLYLWHFPVFVVLHDHAPGLAWPVRTVLGVTIAVAASVASRRWVELPALALKARWTRSSHARPQSHVVPSRL